MSLRRVCVFCGSSPGVRPAYAEAARHVGQALVARGLELVYGGGNIGLMNVVADTVLEAGGRVTGVIPRGLESREVAHRGLSELHVVSSMHERKAMMASLADAFEMAEERPVSAVHHLPRFDVTVIDSVSQGDQGGSRDAPSARAGLEVDASDPFIRHDFVSETAWWWRADIVTTE